ncbi:UDP-glycosyltransferase 90A1 [Ricinus communis]|uniref:Glycosyltransferase n=1 Tax=Ricinus communis TaxID=3988 RepID=B9RUA8_RICCO|nr:UDP-glycosyltransferase 90A1 [Ricinus communis]EEF44895.1 UDP-glucosyltransferase, putative [Ricinus communis]|eukprot:XP_002517353.1 UDP-glycosyltransferase 90A1 [Ricinus communis]
MESLCSEQTYHVVLFPFMAKGHTIPILDLARLFLHRQIAVTIFTTPANLPFIAESLADTNVSIVELSFPSNVPEIPTGIESTDMLPSMLLWPSFVFSTKLMQPNFERALENLPPVNFMVSDGFLWWTLESANKFGFPRFVFFGMSNYAMCVEKAVYENKLLFGPESEEELITVTPFPWIKITRSDFDPSFSNPESKGLFFELAKLVFTAASSSFGYIMNSFYELEQVFVDYWNNHSERQLTWCIGPLCLAERPRLQRVDNNKPTWIQWLDQKLEQGQPVLYVAFGTQTEISLEQLQEISIGLEVSKVNFLWVTRDKGINLEGFEERVKGRGMIVREWVEQREILMHKSVQGFLSHCGWNSVLESMCEGVPILAWPMIAEQPLNARMVVEEIQIGLRVETCDGSVRGFVKSEGLRKTVKELMEGDVGKKTRKKVKEVAKMAKEAMKDNTGSSWRSRDLLIQNCNCKVSL